MKTKENEENKEKIYTDKKKDRIVLLLGLFFILMIFCVKLTIIPSVRAVVPEKKEEYLEYLLLKKKAALLNLENKETANFLPQKVIWLNDSGAQMVPRPDPYRKVYRPEDPMADPHGIIKYPNVDQKAELETIKSVEEELKKINVTHHKRDI